MRPLAKLAVHVRVLTSTAARRSGLLVQGERLGIELVGLISLEVGVRSARAPDRVSVAACKPESGVEDLRSPLRCPLEVGVAARVSLVHAAVCRVEPALTASAKCSSNVT